MGPAGPIAVPVSVPLTRSQWPALRLMAPPWALLSQSHLLMARQQWDSNKLQAFLPGVQCGGDVCLLHRRRSPLEGHRTPCTWAPWALTLPTMSSWAT